MGGGGGGIPRGTDVTCSHSPEHKQHVLITVSMYVIMCMRVLHVCDYAVVCDYMYLSITMCVYMC